MDENTEAPAVMPAQVEPPRVLGNRSKVIPLEYPVEFGGKTYTEITVRRMSGAEVSAYFGEAVEMRRLPMFDCPHEVLDALDADDSERVSEVMVDFLPRQMRVATG